MIQNTLRLLVRLTLQGPGHREVSVQPGNSYATQIVAGWYDWQVVREGVEDCAVTGGADTHFDTEVTYRLVCDEGKDLDIGFEGRPPRLRVKTTCFFTCEWEALSN